MRSPALLPLAALALLFAQPAAPQGETTSAIVGQVAGQSGAALPGAAMLAPQCRGLGAEIRGHCKEKLKAPAVE
jgi:hypothetical protein